MTKKHILLFVYCTIGVLAILTGLYALSPLTKEVYRGGFDRNLITEWLVKNTKIVKLPSNGYYLAGTSPRKVYLGNWSNPFHMIVIDAQTLDSQHVTLKIKPSENLNNIEKFKLRVDSPNFYLMNGLMPGIFRGKITDGNAYQIMEDTAFFAIAEPIGKKSFALRSYGYKNQSFELAKQSSDAGGFKFKYGILEKQIDGIFCVEGMIHKNEKRNEIVYVYKYRNQYIVMDTSLNLKYRLNTLDTFSHASIKVADLKSTNTKMLTGTPRTINQFSAVDGNYLFINSNVLAKNEHIKPFMEGSTIDIYDLKNKQYISSFNLQNFQNNRLSDLSVDKNKMFALYNDFILINTIDTTAIRKINEDTE